MNDISLKQLEVFVAVVEYGGFTRAAEELFFNQSTISAHISLLEQALGKELFVRSNRRHVRLTSDGEQVYPIAKRILGDCDTLRTLFATEKAGQTLSLGASTVPGQYLLPDYLSNFLKKEKDFRYSLRRGDSAQVHQMLKDGEISLGFVGAISEPNTVDYYPLAEDKLVLVTPNTPYYRQLQENGTYGRDLLSRVIAGSRVSLIVGLLAVIIACVIGTTLGMIAGYFGGVVDDIINRTSEAVRVIPQIVFAIALCAVFGGGILNLAIVLGISNTTVYIRMMRSQVLSIKERDYIMAGKLQGNSNFRLMFHHILPNSISPIIVTMTQQVGNTILSEAGLSFLGLGISKPTATWGALVNGGRSFLLTNPIYSLAPGIAIALLVICLNTLGDGVRDALDPRLRGEV